MGQKMVIEEKRKNMPFVMTVLILILIMAAFLSGCFTTLKTPEIKGVVLDVHTGNPIADARIYGRWQRTLVTPASRTSGGVSKELRLKTGQDGKFKIPPYSVFNYIPYPFGQEGSFYMIVYALGYQNKHYWFTSESMIQNTDIDEFKAALDGKESFFRLSEVKNPKEWLANSSEIYKDSKLDQKFLNDEDRLFLEKFGDRRWDRVSQAHLADTYARFGDYQSAVRKLEELIKDYPEEGKYYLKSLEEYKRKLKEMDK